MTPFLAAALSGAACGTLTGIAMDLLRRRFLVGPPRSRWCRRCWAFAVVRMDGWDTCLRCGDAAWHQDLETHTATTEKPKIFKPGHSAKITLLRGGRPETKP